MDEKEFIDTFTRIIQRFGLLARDKTPCGETLSVSQAHTLSLLLHSEFLTQKELARQLCLEKSTTSRLVHDLVGNRLIERRPDPEDRRKNQLHLTESGRRRAREIERARRDHFRSILERIPENQRETVNEAFNYFLDALPANECAVPDGSR